jgi:SPP1 gp7 family putative phage head morphogenesis protein
MSTLDSAIEHQVNLERYKSSVSKKYAAYVNQLANDVHTILSSLSNTYKDIRAAIVSINALIDSTYNKVGIDYLEDIKGLLESEVPYVARSVNYSNIDEDSDAILSLTLSSLLLGLSLTDHLLAQKSSIKRVIKASIMSGYLNKVPISDVARGIRGTKVSGYKDGIWNTANNKLSSITTTGVQHYTTEAKVRVWKAASDDRQEPLGNAKRDSTEQKTIDKYIWISVLDSRTTPVCRGRSNKVYVVGNGPKPPAHPRCRSIIHPYSEALVVPESYSEWLRRQPRGTIDDILGEAKAKLFISGKVTLDKFVTESGRELTLQQLKTKLGSA